MADSVLAALIAVGGMLVVAILGAAVQFVVTKQLIRSEFGNTVHQLAGEAGYRRAEAKAERIADAVSQLLAIADPEANADIIYRDVVALIHRIQLLRDSTSRPGAELRGALSELGLELRTYLELPDRYDEFGEATFASLLVIHGRIAGYARAIVAVGHRPAPVQVRIG